MLYTYKYIDSQGRRQKATIDASSLKEAKEKLHRQGIIVIGIEDKTLTKSFFKKNNTQLSKEHLVNYTTQLSQLLNAGIPLYESLLSLEEQYRTESFHPILNSLCESIKGGVSLSDAMKGYPHSFDKLYCSMVAAGESVGALDITLAKLAELLNKQMKLRKQLLTAMIYPALLGCFSLLIIFLLLTFAIPSIETIFQDQKVNGFTKLVMQVSHFLTHYWWLYLPAFLGGCVFLHLWLKSAAGKAFKYRIALKLPIVKVLSIQTAISRFSRTMGTLLQGGVSIITALQISRQVMKNPLLEEIFEKAEGKIVEGSSLATELRRSNLIPPLVSRMLAIGEESGDIAIMLHKIADLYEDDLEKNLTRATSLAQPLILLVMGGVVGIIMLAVLLPLTDVSAFIN